MGRYRTNTNQECKKCKGLLDKVVDLSKGFTVYVCTDCGTVFERNLGDSGHPVGKEVEGAKIRNEPEPEF